MTDTPWPHFNKTELQCHCGCGVMGMAPDFMSGLEKLRISYGLPLTITSGYRCPQHNSAVSHTGEHGPHTTGRAVDICIEGGEALRLLQLAQAQGFKRIGVSQNGAHGSRFIHLDTCTNPDYPSPALWSY